MRAAEIVTASMLIFLGGIVLFDAVRLGIGWGMDGPRSGFFPFWLALIMYGLRCDHSSAGAQDDPGRLRQP